MIKFIDNGIKFLLVGFVFSIPAIHATPNDESWQKQVLLAVTDEQYLVLETSGYFQGYPPQIRNMVRYVTYDSSSNEEVSSIIVTKTLREFEEGKSVPKLLENELELPLSKVLSEFNGLMVPPSRNLIKKFVSDDSGLYVDDEGKRVLVFTSAEMQSRQSGSGLVAPMYSPKAIGIQQVNSRYYLTIRDEAGGQEIVMRINR